MLSSFYDLWSLTSIVRPTTSKSRLWIAFKFLWSLVFDITIPTWVYNPTVVNCFQVFMIFGLWHLRTSSPAIARCCELLSSFYDLWSLTSLLQQVGVHPRCELLSSFYDLWSLTSKMNWKPSNSRCELLSSFYDLWSLTSAIFFNWLIFCCELLSSFYDLWSLTSLTAIIRYSSVLWIAFKFLWSLVFDIRGKILTLSLYVVNCFQVFMIFGLWHRSHITLQEHISCELLSSFYDLWSLTSESNNVNRYN